MAIPTLYNGIQFRSRLEARYAAFFDLCGVSWLYEPLDLAGYIPDFIVTLDWTADESIRFLLEVKGATDSGELWAHVEKIDRSGWDEWAYIVCSDPSQALERRFGVLNEKARTKCMEIGEERRKNISLWIAEDFRVVVPSSHEGLGWYWKHSDGIRDLCVHHDSADTLEQAYARTYAAWDEAGNVVQWKAPRHA